MIEQHLPSLPVDQFEVLLFLHASLEDVIVVKLLLEFNAIPVIEV